MRRESDSLGKLALLAALLTLSAGAGDRSTAPVSAGSASGARPVNAGPKVPQADLLDDFRIARQALEEGHIGLYRRTSKGDLDRLFDRTGAAIDRPLDAFEFYRLVAPVVAAIKCGHTEVGLPADVRQELETRTLLLPMRVRLLDRKVYVFRDLSAGKDGRLAGSEIRSVNGLPIARIVDTMLAATPGDGDVESSRPLLLDGWRFSLQLVALLGLPSPYRMEVRNHATGKVEQVSLEGVPLPTLREVWRSRYPQDQRPITPAEVKEFDDGSIALLTIRNFEGFADAAGQQKLDDFLKESFEGFEVRHTRALIIDLRSNGGGYDYLGALLLAYLVDEPFTHYADIAMNDRTFDFLKYAVEDAGIQESWLKRRADGRYHLVGHPTWGVQKPVASRFKGKVYVLINGGSFSTTSEFVSQAHFHRRATFVGQEAGGAYDGNTAGFMPVLELPHSKLRLEIPLVSYRLAVGAPPHAGRGVMPDEPVGPTIDDLLAGRDAELEKALALARQADAPEARRLQPRILFERELPNEAGRRDVAANVLPLPDGGALITGWTSAGTKPADGLVIRVDADANVIWRREPGGEPIDLLFSAQSDGEGGFVCAGMTATRGAGSMDGWVVRLDAAGAVTRERTYGGAEEDRLVSIQPARDGWMAGGQTSRGGNVDAWVVTLDRDGRERSSWTWGGEGIQRGLGLEALPDGGCLVTGRIGEGHGDGVDGFIVRLGADGRAVWDRTIGGPGFQVAYYVRSIRPAARAAGDMLPPSFLVTGYGFLDQARDHEAYVLRLAADGTTLARNDLGGPSNDRGVQSVVLEDGSTLTVGYTKRPGAVDSDPAWHLVLYALDPKGRPTWTGRLGGDGVESGHWIAGTAGNLWVVGQTTKTPGESRVLVARLDATGLMNRGGR